MELPGPVPVVALEVVSRLQLPGESRVTSEACPSQISICSIYNSCKLAKLECVCPQTQTQTQSETQNLSLIPEPSPKLQK